MGHNHSDHSHHHHHHHVGSNIKIAFFLNLGFTIIEFIGGFLTNSIAIMADAVHDLGDSLSLGLAWKLEGVSKKGRNDKYTYGYKRFSILAALINSLVLILGSAYVLSEAIPRLINPEPSDYLGMFFLALLGVAVNGYGAYKVMKGNSLNEKVISLHLLEDVLGWVGVLIISIINFFIEAPLLDPILAIVFTLFILWSIVKNLRNIIKIFMQRVPSDINLKEIEKKIINLDGISNIHDVHIWTMDSQDHIMTLHVVIGNGANLTNTIEIKKQIRILLKKYNIIHSTIEFDLGGDCEYKNCLEY